MQSAMRDGPFKEINAYRPACIRTERLELQPSLPKLQGKFRLHALRQTQCFCHLENPA